MSTLSQKIDVVIKLMDLLRADSTETQTALALVTEILDKCPIEIWQDSTKTFLDPACGRGIFGLCILQRLFDGLQSVIPDEQERVNHILGKQIFLYDISSVMCMKAKTAFARVIKAAGLVNPGVNIYNKDSLEHPFNMKFDVITGNPPYNPPIKARTGSTGSGSGNKIWQLFIEQGFHVLKEGGIMAMVTPNLWRGGDFTGDRRAHKAAQDILFEKGQTIAWSDCRSPTDHFPMVGHSISIDWWIWQKGKAGEYESLNRYRLLPRKMSDAKSLELWMNTVDADACHQNAFRRGRFPISFYDGGISKNQVSGLHPYCMTGAKTRDGIFGWSSKRVNGVGVAKVIIHDSSGPAPLVDMKGQYGCGEHACAYSVCSAQGASDIVDFFNSNLFKWLTSQVAQEGSLGFPTPFFSRVPFSWRDLQRVICG